ncbi:hypothetical protein K1719_017056 [Acacia pycnantha]|nr:hypothetical protein K1719_028017 [Acacia pycnantha]KAI9111366.1 hypothetical protein K1719_017056 [Acacia pycnantha]
MSDINPVKQFKSVVIINEERYLMPKERTGNAGTWKVNTERHWEDLCNTSLMVRVHQLSCNGILTAVQSPFRQVTMLIIFNRIHSRPCTQHLQ